jgi:hypothetical protein
MFVAPPAESVVARREEFVARPIAILLIKRSATDQLGRPATTTSIVDIDTICHHTVRYRSRKLSIEPARKSPIFQIEMAHNNITNQHIRFRIWGLVLQIYTKPT